MPVAPPPPPTPERRRSQMFSGFNLSARSVRPSWAPRNRSFSAGAWKTTTNVLQQSARPDISQSLYILETESKSQSQAIASLLEQLGSLRLDQSENVLIYSTAMRLLGSRHDQPATHAYNIINALFTHQSMPQSLHVECIAVLAQYIDTTRVVHLPRLLDAVTYGGRNIDGSEHCMLLVLCRLSLSLLDLCSTVEGDTDTWDGAQSFRLAFRKSLALFGNTVRFGSSLDFSEYNTILSSMQKLFSGTEHDEETLELLNITDAFITRGEIPDESLTKMVRVLCTLLATSTMRKRAPIVAKSKATIRWLVDTHAQDRVLSALADLICSLGSTPQAETSAVNGALLALANVLADPVLSKNADFVVKPVLSVLQHLDFKQNSEVLLSSAVLIQTVVEQPHQLQKIVNDVDWDVSAGAFLNVFRAVISRKGKLPANSRAEIENAFRQISTVETLSPRQKRHLVELTLGLGQILPLDLVEAALRSYERPLEVDAMVDEVRLFGTHFIQNRSMSPPLKILAAEIIQSIAQNLQQHDPDLAWVCVRDVIELLKSYVGKSEVQSKLVSVVVDFVTKTTPESETIFHQATSGLIEAAQSCSAASVADGTQPMVKPGSSKEIAAGLVTIFMRVMNSSAGRAKSLMTQFLSLLTANSIDPAASVMLYRVLYRLRSDISNRIYLIISPEGEGLAVNLARASHSSKDGSRRGSKVSTSSDAGPTWKYGDIVGLPEDPPSAVSPVLSSTSSTSSSSLDIPAWLSYAVYVLDSDVDWELYSYTIVHLGAQLTNQTLFADAQPQIRELRSLLCRQLLKQTVPKPPEGLELRQADIAVCLYHVLTMLIGYNHYFSRAETEEMISAFIMGMSAWDRTTVPCLHALTLCCYELPDALQRDLVRIVSQMATIVTKSDAAIHVLEFLAGLSRLDSLARTFRGEEIKVVFGVCFSYIEYVRGKRFNEAQQKTKNSLTRHHERIEDTKPNADELPEYVFALAYQVITFWYITLQKTDRESYLPWMQQRLLATDEEEQREEQALVTLDVVWRLTKRTTQGSSLLAPEPIKDTQVSIATQYSLLTLDRSDPKAIRLVDRRSSGLDEWEIEPDDQTSSLDLLHSQSLFKSEDPFPDSLPAMAIEPTEPAIRAIAILDRTSPIDFFKAGVLYVGEDQTSEGPILANIMGSPDYNAMLDHLGTRLMLEGLRHNTCGLDTSPALSDGTHTIWHRDEVTALIYHVATYMPTDVITDPNCIKKKSHIGNDYVTIVFNNSGGPFRFDTLPSSFNYVYIVVAPEARTTFVETRTRRRATFSAANRNPADSGSEDKHWFERSWFKVQVLTRQDFPPVGSASEAKVVSGKALGMYVRNLVLNACIFANVWGAREGGGGQGGSWKARLAMLRIIRERFGRGKEEGEAEGDG